ncbi:MULTISPECIES: 6-phospho-beta-glucosidase [Carnobacterium]|uniref:6-phospho-beta-glucosidase n=1 Tax=Carnobacterium divergens TaxID=2748 RepID=A0A2R8A363_CARDV|nr:MULTISPECIES: 6-phospho-beta-glucosidase [Carnobacterium]MCO6016863.1 6-phospho-beta-glucosidase [Carnobacterium divergens]MDT1940584.1 6-phospho-beta-glucosidase [Carnobacterium divergens]MDT1943022.1 6-phospho-beta-glucosidase [Carnobacterium divergens]MDT1948829.1 6-phospho-beta-glucosidase [Carnobacterium divergens]MDT1951309.1 6-phospho-beta-glucosidase [Carnobacterium divergens]
MTRDALKIVTIGGGSSYTPELIEGYIKRKDELPIKEIWLVDIEEGKEKLAIVGEMAKRMVKAAGLPWTVHLTLNRREALKDADYVSTQFRVGLLNARIKDERIPLSHGVLGQETNGAGGMFKAFRTIPVILDIIKDMEELCPDAWLVNFTNPAGMVTEAAIKHGGWKKTAGLCNVPIGHRKQAAEKLNLPEDELFFKFAGINHFHWHRVWDKTGKERTAELIDLIYGPQSETESHLKNIHNVPFHYEQIKDLGMLPCGYHRYYYIEDEMLAHSIEEFKKGETRAQVVKATEARLFELYKDPNLDYKPKELEERGGTHYSDAACELIASIQNDKRTDMVVSTANNGTITDLPYDCIVEVSGPVTSHGPEPYNWGAFPPAARGIIQMMKGMEETVIRAAIDGDYGAALHAFTVNPLVPGGAMAKTLLDELLVAHKEHLPQFAEKINEIEATQPETVAYVSHLMESN